MTLRLKQLSKQRAILVALFVLVACTGSFAAAPALGEWKPARPGYRWSFPEDHWARHGYKTEWWYFTGHLESVDPPVRRFGYQFTFFRVGISPSVPELPSRWAVKDVIMGHAALTDLDNGRHRFSELVVRAAPFLGGFGRYPDPELVWSVGPVGTAEKWKLLWNGSAFDFSMRDVRNAMGFALSTMPVKPMIFQAPGGLSRKGEKESEASLYYSFTRLATSGTVEVDGEKIMVTGVSWMDKEFGSNQLGPDKRGWDWFSLQLNDGREIMLYRLRSRSGTSDYASGSFVAADGTVHYLAPGEWTLKRTGSWTSPRTDASYPAAWTLEVPDFGIRAVITPDVADQENRSLLIPALNYWEGSVSVESMSGAPLGKGYVELTGYGKGSRPPI